MGSIYHHRGVGYAIHTQNGLDWVWKIYPRNGEGDPICGSTRGSEQDAVSACVEAIEFHIMAHVRERRRTLNRVPLSL